GGGGGGYWYPCPQKDSLTTGFYYLGEDLLADYRRAGGSTTLIGNYVYVNGERIAKFEGGSIQDVDYYLTDHLGSVVAQVDHAGTVRVRDLYRPWGEKLYSTVSGNRENQFQYTGQYQDQELSRELAYYGRRYYDPGLRVFTSVDPKWAQDPGTGSYVYCRNNPVRYVDPDGGATELAAKVAQMVGFATIAATAGLLTYSQNPEAFNSVGDAIAQTAVKLSPGLTAQTVGTALLVGATIAPQLLLAEQSEAPGADKNPNPNGRKGDEAHQQGVKDAAERARSELPDAEVKTEGKINTPGGVKPARWGDVVAYDVHGRPIKAWQVGRTLRDGSTPVSRERAANNDMSSDRHARVYSGGHGEDGSCLAYSAPLFLYVTSLQTGGSSAAEEVLGRPAKRYTTNPTCPRVVFENPPQGDRQAACHRAPGHLVEFDFGSGGRI
ncbi:MAG: RHS repeat-associated core domain-containing protein, partial [Candidatus Zixiibacteriota bacterium]